jgi:FkbM family methyltransferase
MAKNNKLRDAMKASEIPQIEAMHSSTTFSIEAEDLLVERIFYQLLGNRSDRNGLYVDLGAFDPIQHSNTYRLYKRGWRGINVEANPEAKRKFSAIRPLDTTLNVAIGPDGQTGKYLCFDEPLLNGFLDQAAIDHHLARGHCIISEHSVEFVSINCLLKRHMPRRRVDFLNIDIEGMEHFILSEWDFSQWLPSVIAIEIHGFYGVTEISETPVANLLKERGYTFVSRLWHTSIFARI